MVEQFVSGQQVEGANESLRLFALCEGMNWAHLPLPGGIYAQHPKMLDDFAIIFRIRSDYEREKANREQAKARNKNPQ